MAEQQIGGRTRGERFVGKLVILLTIISFVVVGLLLNCLQFLLVVTSRLSKAERWRRAHKRANGFLLYAIFAQPIFILYAWSRVKLQVLLDDLRLLDDVRKQLCAIIIANHTFELDWMACFIMADQLGDMGSYKCFAKAELKYLPIIGWAFWMSDLIYVRRNWLQDRHQIGRQLDELLIYDQILLGIFAEGTRWTAEKQADSEAFARARQLAPYKHHLNPRPRGFTYTLRHYLRRQALEPASMAGKPVRVFNLQIAMPDKLNFSDFLEGRQVRADVYVEEVEISDELRQEALESTGEHECPRARQLLRNIYTRKDQLMDHYERHGQRFLPSAHSRNPGPFPVRKPYKAFAYWLLSMCLTYGSFGYAALTSSLAATPTFWALTAGLLVGGMLMLKRIEHESKPTKLRNSATKLL